MTATPEQALRQWQEAWWQTLPAWRAAELKAEADEAERRRAQRQQENEAATQARQAQFDADQRARTAAAAEQLKAHMRERFLETPGATPEAFEDAWPELLRQHQIAQTVGHTPNPQDELKAFFRARSVRGGLSEEASHAAS